MVRQSSITEIGVRVAVRTKPKCVGTIIAAVAATMPSGESQLLTLVNLDAGFYDEDRDIFTTVLAVDASNLIWYYDD